MSKKTTAVAETTVKKNDLTEPETQKEESKDLNESALQKVEEKFAEQNDAPKESTDIVVSKEGHQALVVLLQGENGELPDDILLTAAHQIAQFNELKDEADKLRVVLIGAGWSGAGSVVEAARQYIIRLNAEIQVLDTALIANSIKEPLSPVHPIEAVVRFFQNPQNWKRPQPIGRKLAEGTTLTVAGEVVTLAQDAVVNYVDDQNDQKFVGLCVHSGNFEVNKERFKFRYSGLGTRLPLEEQVDDPSQLNDFIAKLSESEAYSFNVTERWNELKAKEAAEKEAAEAAESGQKEE